MSFPFVVKKRPPLLICATRDRMGEITDHQRYFKFTVLTREWKKYKSHSTPPGTELYMLVEPGQTWGQLEDDLYRYSPSEVYLYLEKSLSKMPLYKTALVEKIKSVYGPQVKVTPVTSFCTTSSEMK